MTFWNWKKKAPPPESKSAQSLADIARGMQFAVNSTQELTEQHFQRIIERYFNENGTAITRHLILPDGSVLDVPLISLIPPSGLMLKEMTVEMAVRIDQTTVKDHPELGNALTRTSFQVSISPRKGDSNIEQNIVDITMKFVAGDPPEGVSRIMEYYANAAVPKKAEPPAPTTA